MLKLRSRRLERDVRVDRLLAAQRHLEV